MAYDNTKYAPIAAGSKGDKGNAGSDGTYQDTGAWATATAYATNDRAQHAKTGYGLCQYRCKANHTSGSSTEPEVGASWATYWELWVGGGQDGAGTGDVVGPASATTNDLAGFADVTGKLLKSLGSFATNLATSLSALTASTTATDGDVDAIAVKETGGWKLKTADNYAKRKIMGQIVASAWQPTATAGCGDPANAELATNKMNLRTIPFGYASKSYACAFFDLPMTYDGGTIDAYIVWESTGTTSNGVRFGLQMASVGDNESWDLAWGSAVEITDNATGAAHKRLMTGKIADITPSGTPAGGETVEVRLYRDPAHADDNLNEIINVANVRFLIPINKHSEA